MTQPEPVPGEDEVLALFCAQLPRWRLMWRGPAMAGRRAEVERAVAAARRGEPIAGLVGRLGLGAGAEPAAPAEEDDGGDVSVRTSLPTGVHEAEPGAVTGVYVCPKGSCGRAEVRGAGSELPSCGIHDQALRYVADAR